MHGWIGKILRVDLGTGKITTEALKPELARDYIGARGLGTKYMYDEVDPTVDPLSPANKLIFASGPMTGTFAPSAGRYDVVTKGPLTGTIAASNSGGAWGPELKYAGYDMLILEGRAEKPVYLWIQDDKVEIRDAAHLWGKDVPETTEALNEETAVDAKIACIGPAGEKLSYIAAIMNDMQRAAGRTGVGAVMGSKNLKAVVVRGTGSVTVADKEAFLAAVAKASTMIKEHPVGGTGLRLYGTNVLVNILNSIGGLPTNNFQDGHFPTADKVGGETLAANQLQRPKGCFSCIISCGRATKVTNPKYKGEGEGPEYETAWGFGPDCQIDDLDAVLKANYYCNEYGLDTISMGGTVACAMELFNRGIITLDDTEGLELDFGNAEAMVEAVRLTGLGQGFGKKLALGSYRLASLYGHPELSMTVKKQEMPAYDPRAVQGIGLNYATNNRGGCHVRGYSISPEVLGVPFKVDKDSIDGKAELVALFQNLTAALDSSGSCLFTTFGIGAPEFGELMTALTGFAYSGDSFVEAGERIWNLERLWNLKSGLTAADDTLPPRLLNEPIVTGASKGSVSRLPEMLPLYYGVRGWDAQGVPTKEKLSALALA
ncbi:aldehyde ferredoxin oxidoreductase (plasmid) [Azospirillum humicireducens]|uniref:Aldehyde ferredoxin oxidoreductase n=1 Tax=Azospirillum humicireducens TaxID=1226968 RepID=A0A2R4VPX6_9PROT|nr:aldehyde ferredoxin oxidoreductase family protein [Azospirillum humicireducens]AWB06488.1 aldehyde ferredoxin oxidoreductase [Azospirillum humicireducens]